MKADINGITLSYEDAGTGPAVLLIHGFPLNRGMWRHQKEAIVSAGFRFIAPDLRGFGDSEAPGGSYSMSLLADDVAGLLDHLGIRRAVLGGMSMGGYVLFDLLERHGDRAHAACFITTRSTVDNDDVKSGRLALLETARKYGAGFVAGMFAPTLFAAETIQEKPELVAELREMLASVDLRGVEGALRAMLDRKDYTSQLGAFTLPSLVIGADRDRTVQRKDIGLLAGGLPDSRLCMISGAGHLANMERPAVFNDCLLGFLRRLEWS